MRVVHRSLPGGWTGDHRRFVPVGFVGGAPLDGGRDLVVALGEDRGLDFHRLADDPLRRKAPVIHRRRHAFDRDPGIAHRFIDGLLVGGLRAALDLRLREQHERLGRGPEHARFAGRQRERGERFGRGLRVVERTKARELARHRFEQMQRIDVDGFREVGIDDDERGGVGVAQVGTVRANQRGERRAGAGQRAQLAGTRERAVIALQRVCPRDVLRQIETRLLARALVFGRDTILIGHRQADAVFETHRHEHAGADGGRRVQCAAICALDERGVARVVQIGQQPRAERLLGKRDRRRDAHERGVFIDEPRALEIPPARRREHGVEPRIGQAVQVVPADVDGPCEQSHFRVTLAHRRAEPPPDVRGHLVRGVEAKAADSRIREQQQFARPPFGEVLRRFAVTEIRVCNVFLARRMTRIEPRLGALERMEPVLVLLIQPAICTHAIDHDVDEQRQAVLLRGIGELAETFARRFIGFEGGMQAVMIGDGLTVPVRTGHERRAGQDVVETQRGSVLELGRPVRDGADEKRVDEINTRRVRMMGGMVFHRSSFPKSSCGGGDAGNRRDHAHGRQRANPRRMAAASGPRTV